MHQIPLLSAQSSAVSGGYVEVNGEIWYRVSNVHMMPEFFMSPVSAGDHWMFISSGGALTVGRRDADSALFPYLSSDKLVDTASSQGPKTVIQVNVDGEHSVLWEPFSRDNACDASIQRNLYKNSLGNQILFEEVNQAVGLSFRYRWSWGNRFGFVRSCSLTNQQDRPVSVELLDGLQNILPDGLNQDFQLRYANLGDAYKTSELIHESKLAIYSLGSIPTDRAEPSEALRATVAWQAGLPHPKVLLDAEQIDRFRSGMPVVHEDQTRGLRGAYFVQSKMVLGGDQPNSAEWKIVADVALDHADVARLNEHLLQSNDIHSDVDADIAANERRLKMIVGCADGIQMGQQRLRTQRHQSNVLFNIMRGGVSTCGYEVSVADFRCHVQRSNRAVASRQQSTLSKLPKTIERSELLRIVDQTGDLQFRRIALEYLPLSFSRRHGDPTRPWNKFSIRRFDASGVEPLGYEGNWRDIFQNWEALSFSFPEFTLSMILRFVCASTADGYNPYRISKDGFEWETVEPNDPWSNIGYWGDHQIVYLLKLLESSKQCCPSVLDQLLNETCCTYAQVPYRIRQYDQMQRNPQETIQFDDPLAAEIDVRVANIGSDGKLLLDSAGMPRLVTLAEKLLLPALVKMTNLVPDGGIWMNTQRPEWNDANNALVGRGLSVVTTAYLRRYLAFMRDWFSGTSIVQSVALSSEVAELLRGVAKAVDEHAMSSTNGASSRTRKSAMDRLSNVGCQYRTKLYETGLSGDSVVVSIDECIAFLDGSLTMIDATLRSNRRDDGLYHAYNLLELDEDAVHIERLPEMLEGQVAILSSGMLSAVEVADVLDVLRSSRLYREDQQSYMLCPNRQLPRFMEKNLLPPGCVEESNLLRKLNDDGNTTIVNCDVSGQLRFSGDFRNESDLNKALDRLQSEPHYVELVDQDRALIARAYEQTFAHRNYTGRSGTFFAYEGLGSIYWHMVSKLSLAVIENCIRATQTLPADDELETQNVVRRLHQHYQLIREGIGVNKSPEQFGAIPTDPYSHTPENAGAKQPGMTGQVKEDILSRWMELGVRIDVGVLSFDPRFFESSEFLTKPTLFDYVDVHLAPAKLSLASGSFAFTLCQVPIIYRLSDEQKTIVHAIDDQQTVIDGWSLSNETTHSLFARDGSLLRIEVYFSLSSCC